MSLVFTPPESTSTFINVFVLTLTSTNKKHIYIYTLERF